MNKILEDAAEYAVLAGGKEKLKSCEPAAALSESKARLNRTKECVKLLFTYGLSKVEYYEPLGDSLTRAEKARRFPVRNFFRREICCDRCGSRAIRSREWKIRKSPR